MVKKIAFLVLLPSIVYAAESQKSVEKKSFEFIKKPASPLAQRLIQLKAENAAQHITITSLSQSIISQEKEIQELKEVIESYKQDLKQKEKIFIQLQEERKKAADRELYTLRTNDSDSD